MMPDISVIIPTYNRAIFLDRAVRSVLAQTYRNFEIIIIDDASSDNIEDEIRSNFSHEMDLGVLRYVRNETNLERSRSRNKGVFLSKGNYIAFLDDDDIWLPDHLKQLIAFLEYNPESGCVFGKPIWLFEDGSIADKLHILFPDIQSGSGTFYRNACLRGNTVFSPTSLMRKYVFEKIGGFREDISQNEDWEFFSRLAMNFDVGYLNTVTCCIYMHKATHSKSVVGKGAYIKENVLNIIENNLIKYNYPLDAHVLSYVYVTMSNDFIPIMNKSREYLFKSLKIDPMMVSKLSTWGLFLRVMLGQTLYVKFKRIKELL